MFCGFVRTEAYAQVAEEWVATYNGPINGYDVSRRVIVDQTGNVYVTGTSGGSASSWWYPQNDYLTIKYNSTGVKLWEARYNGPGNGSDNPTAIAVDASGNVYVTGNSLGSNGSWDFATVKYNIDGIQQWVSRYDGPGWYAGANAMTVDASGNVYVTGHSAYDAPSYGIWTGGFDIVTIKYNTDGIQQWKVAYNDPVGDGDDYPLAIAVSGSGDIYVAGTIGGKTHGWYYYGRQYGIIKYNSNGMLQWVAKYDGPAHGEDVATSLALAVDTGGNVYVTGYSDSMAYSGPSRAYFDYATVKYNFDGVLQWVARYNGPGDGEDTATSLAVDANGNVYVTGYSTGAGTGYDYATIKYNADGIEQWVASYNGPGNGHDQASQIAIDTSGNVYVTGGSYGLGTGTDYATVKYDPSGMEQWVMRYNGLGNGEDTANSIALDTTGNVYVTGGSYSGVTGMDYATIKYSQMITVTIDIKPGSYPNSINPDSNGVIAVAILSTGTFDATDVDPLTVKFGHNGATETHGTGHFEDVNGDSLLDLVLHFDTRATGVKDGDTSMTLYGKTYSGLDIQGSDSIVTVGRKK